MRQVPNLPGIRSAGDKNVDRKVLVLGCGAVGRSAISALLKLGATVSASDINSANCGIQELRN